MNRLEPVLFGLYPDKMQSLLPEAGSRPDALAGLIRALKARAVPRGRAGRPVATGWEAVDGGIGGLGRGVLHEWMVDAGPGGVLAGPVGVFAHLADRAQADDAEGSLVVWVGRRCWAYPRALSGGLIGRSVFVEPRDRGERVWALDVALRSLAVGVVIGDGSGLGMGESRRLQVAAGGGKALCLLARPMGERGALSAAWTRWAVHPAATGGDSPAWVLELLRCKGVRPSAWEAERWLVGRNYETGVVGVVSDACDRPVAASGSSRRASG